MFSERSLSFRGRLSRQTVTCPGCRQVWLAPGLSGGDEYVCKKCGAAFVSAAGGRAVRPHVGDRAGYSTECKREDRPFLEH